MMSLHQKDNPQTWKDKPLSNLKEISIPLILQPSNAKLTRPSRICPRSPEAYTMCTLDKQEEHSDAYGFFSCAVSLLYDP